MRPPFNSFQSQARPPPPQRQQHQHQQNNGYPSHHQHNGYQNPVNSNQLGMMNPQMMSNPMMSHMNNPIPMANMPIHPQFFNNMPQQQQQQLNQFAINQLLPNLLGNLQFAVANNNLMGHSLPFVQPNFFQPSLEPSAFTSQPQHNSFNPLSYPPVPPPHQNQQLHPPGPPGFSKPPPQGQGAGSVNNTNYSASKGNDFRNTFTKHQNFKGPGQGFQRPQLHQANNGKRKFGFNKDPMGKVNYDKKATRFDGSDAGNIAEEKKSTYVWDYTPEEIQKWCEARRKCYPRKLKVAKKGKKKVSRCILDEEARLRRQQLLEVRAKQVELNCEVAVIPKRYLSNIDEQVNGDRGDNNGQLENDQRGSFQNKRRRGEKDKRNKKPRFQDKEPTLLEKLLSADIKRDKTQLLQVFRFMVINSFFKEELPEQPLKLPLVMVEETGCEHAREDPTIEFPNDDDDGDDNSCDEAVEK